MSIVHDAIIIGAGHNSLACASHLAARGWSVGIYEQADTPGGAIKTGEYTRSGYHHDWAAMNLSLFAGSTFHTENAEELRTHGLDFASTENAFARPCCMDQDSGGFAPYPITSDDALIYRMSETSHAVERF